MTEQRELLAESRRFAAETSRQAAETKASMQQLAQDWRFYLDSTWAMVNAMPSDQLPKHIDRDKALL